MVKKKQSSFELLTSWRENKPAINFLKDSDSELENLAKTESKSFEESVEKLMSFHGSLVKSHDLAHLISRLDDFEYDSSAREIRKDIKENGKVDNNKLSKVTYGFYESLNNVTSRLNIDFKRLSDEFDNAREQGEISSIAKRLEDVANHYLELDKEIGIQEDKFAKNADKDLTNYSVFVDEKNGLDERLDSFLEQYNPEIVDFGSLVDFDHEISSISKGYKKLVRKYGSWFGTKVRGKPSVFGCYEERDIAERLSSEIGNWKSNYKAVDNTRQSLLSKIDEIDSTLNIMNDENLPLKDRIHAVKSVKLIKGKENLREIPVLKSLYEKLDSKQEEFNEQSDNYDFIHTTKAKISEFTDNYHEVLEVLNDKYHIDLNFVHWIKSIELTEPDFLHSVSNIAHLAYDVTQLTTLEGFVKKGIEVAMGAIDNHLDDRFNEAKDIYKLHDDSEPISKLESAVNILDEIAVIYKVIDGSTQAVEGLKSQINEKKKYQENLLNAEPEIKVEPIIESAQLEEIASEELFVPEPSSISARNPGFVYTTGPNSNFQDLPFYLSVIGFPPSKYIELMNTMLGKNKERHWGDRLEKLNERLDNLPLASNIGDLDYMYHFEHAVREDMNSGNMSHLVRRNSGYNGVATSVTNKLSEYINNSEQALDISQQQIMQHQAFSGPQNKYNKSFV